MFLCYTFLALSDALFPGEHFSFFAGSARQLTRGFVIQESGEPITIPRDNDSRYPRGITIRGKLPSDVGDEDYLLVSLAHQDCLVRVGEETLYSYDYTHAKRKNHSAFATLSSYCAMIPLSSADAGKPLTITYRGYVPGYSSNIGRLMVGTFGELIGSLIGIAGWSALFAGQSLVLGVFMTVIGAVLLITKRQTAVFHIGTFAILISLWILSDSLLRQVYMNDLSIGYYLTMTSLSLACTPILLFFNEMQRGRCSRLYYSAAAANLALAVLFFLLQITDTAGYMSSLKIIQTEMAITVVILIGTAAHDRRKHYPTYLGRIFLVGIAVLALAAVVEIASMWNSLNNRRGLWTGLGLFVFLISLTWTALRALGMQMKTQQDEVLASREQTEKMGIQLLTTLVNAVDAKDPYTNGHSNRVAMYAREIARRDHRNEAYQNRLFYMAIVHDIGKIGIPDSILKKPGRLSDEEFAIIRTHPRQGAEILSDVTEMPWITTGARWHHERYDGRGYPDGLAGTDIPEEARIIAVADAYDAMTSDRSYRARMNQAKVRSIMAEGRGTQFDPHFADLMIEMIDEDRDYQLRGSTGSDLLGLISLSLLLDQGSQGSSELSADDERLRPILQNLRKYARQNQTAVQLLLLTLHVQDDLPAEVLDATAALLERIARSIMRKDDLLARLGDTQLLIVLTDPAQNSAESTMKRISARFPSGENVPCSLTWEVRDIDGE